MLWLLFAWLLLHDYIIFICIAVNVSVLSSSCHLCFQSLSFDISTVAATELEDVHPNIEMDRPIFQLLILPNPKPSNFYVWFAVLF